MEFYVSRTSVMLETTTSVVETGAITTDRQANGQTTRAIMAVVVEMLITSRITVVVVSSKITAMLQTTITKSRTIVMLSRKTSQTRAMRTVIEIRATRRLKIRYLQFSWLFMIHGHWLLCCAAVSLRVSITTWREPWPQDINCTVTVYEYARRLQPIQWSLTRFWLFSTMISRTAEFGQWQLTWTSYTGKFSYSRSASVALPGQ